MKIIIGNDHAGPVMKKKIAEELAAQGHEVVDIGIAEGEACDYPEKAVELAGRVASGEFERGILICGTGIGMSMAANRVAGVRAAAVSDEMSCEFTRRHNDANVLCLGERVISVHKAIRLTDMFIKTPFEGGRHQRRVDLIAAIDAGK